MTNHDTARLRVTYGATTYLAVEVARGAAYELFSEEPEAGFLPSPYRGGPAWHRFVHATEVSAIYHPDLSSAPEPMDSPVQIPLSRALDWAQVHRMTQTPAGRAAPVLRAIRRTATIARGTRMVKILSARQFAGYLRGWLPAGFCYREYDVAHLRTPDDLRLLGSDNPPAGGEPDIAFALRWRAVGADDYAVPDSDSYPGLVGMSPHDRIGPPVLGTGFTPSDRYVIPEFVTVDFTDLPLPANATLLAYTPEGIEVVLYTFQPEQRGWVRMVGPQWRHLLAGVPDVVPEREYVPVPPRPPGVRLVGWYRGQEYDAVADPPTEFRVLAMTRAARYPVEALARRTRYVTWRGARCSVLRDESGWLRLRLCRPDPAQVAAPATTCFERGVYELWAPAGDVTDRAVVEVRYPP